MEIIQPTLKGQIPAPQPEWAELCYAILSNGLLGILRATHDIRRELKKRREMMDGGWTGNLPPLFPEGTKACLSVFDGAVETPCLQFELVSAFPLFDRLADGHWLVVEPRCRPPETNARILDETGATVRSFCLGDGIEYIQSDDQGDIWVGYFDEGVFGNDGWKPEGSVPDVRLGLNRFDAHGRMTWAYIDDDHLLADCYAMNVSPGGIWSCYYPDFPILHVGYDGLSHLWHNSKSGARLIAVDGNRIVLLGGYPDHLGDGRDESRDGSLLRLDGNGITHLGDFKFDLAGLDPRRLAYSGVRADRMHFVDGCKWYTLSVEDIAGALDR